MIAPPARWLTDHAALLPPRGEALDVACGSGRHAIWLAERGLRVHAVDRDAAAIAGLRAEADRRGLSIDAEVLDLEAGTAPIARERYDLIVVVHYLHRPLFAGLVAALKPGGLLVYETFTAGQAARGKPTNPAFLLNEGELRELAWPLEILVDREGDFDGRLIAGLIARRS